MECQEALEWMEAATVLGAAVPDAELRLAKEHLETCAACQVAWPRREAWARSLGSAIRDVAVPAGLRTRLLADLPQVEVSLTDGVPGVGRSATGRKVTGGSKQRRSSQRFVWGGSTVAVILLIGAMLRIMWTPEVRFSLSDLLVGSTITITELTEFQGDFEPQLPRTWTNAFTLDRSVVRGYPNHGPGRGEVAIVPFQYTLRGEEEPLRGRLLILADRQLQSAPELHQIDELPTRFRDAEIRYSPQGLGAHAVWREGNLVFICLMPSGPADLHRFQKALVGTASLT